MRTDDRELVPFDEGIGSIFEAILRGRLETITVGIVKSFDPVRQVADIQPAIRRKLDGETDSRPRPILSDVRVVFFGSGDFWITTPINPGDPVLLLTPSRSLDVWFTEGGVVDPGSNQIFQLSDAVAIPGILSDADVIPAIATDGIHIRGRDASAPSLKLKTDGIEIVGNLRVLGDVVIGELIPLSLAGHVHPTPAGPSEGPIPAPVP